jgi:hypothetical protein
MNFPKFWGDGKPTLLVPYLKDCGDFHKQAEVTAQCKKCAVALATHLFVWRKVFPSKSAVKFWCPTEKKFLGMSLQDFQNFVNNHYSIRTADHKEFLLDPSIASLVLEQCIAEDSPLPVASWAVEAQRRRAA